MQDVINHNVHFKLIRTQNTGARDTEARRNRTHTHAITHLNKPSVCVEHMLEVDIFPSLRLLFSFLFFLVGLP